MLHFHYKSTLSLIFFILFLTNIYLEGQIKISNVSTIQQTEKGVFGMPQLMTDNWSIDLSNITASDNVYSIPKSEIRKMKEELAMRRKAVSSNEPMVSSRSEDKAYIGSNFNGNVQGNNIPPDNTIAVSKNGFIVSSINSNVIFTNTGGKLSFTQNLTDFFSFLGLGSSVYDSRVLYDVELNRFVLLALHGNTPQTTKILLAFSKYEDPAAGWYYYSIKGNPLNDNRWFDYPNVGMTQKDLFITGLMRDNNGDWQYSILFQLDKKKCFSGQEASYIYHSDIYNADGTLGFNLVPAHSAWTSYPNQKMYFISNIAQGGNQYHLHTIDGGVEDLPKLTAKVSLGLQTALAPDGIQKGTNNVMNTFDSRIWNAMELNGVIHFGGHVNSPNNTSAILYGRYDLASDIVDATLYYDGIYDYAFPSIAAFGEDKNSDKILINFLKTSKDIFPSQGAVVCKGYGSNFDWGKESLTKSGLGFVDALNENLERWGDYTTVSRRFTNQKIEVWTTGCYGRSSSYGTWLAQYFADSTSTFVDYGADSTSVLPGRSSVFSIYAPKIFTQQSWTFEGGEPQTSSAINPKVKYNNVGTYDVTLKLTDNNGKEHIYVKEDFITVGFKPVPPIANFTADNDTIFQGQSVKFTDKSTNDPLDYTWSFQNGIPATSKEKNPSVQYTKKGSHYVNLSVKNTAGNDNEIKQKFITVLEVPQPQANFEATKTVVSLNEEISFNDLTSNYPLSWKWSFPGGNPSTSTERNPKVTYGNVGSYDVTLEATNATATNIVTKTGYINVSSVSTEETKWISASRVYPNPANQNDKINVSFTLNEAQEARIYLMNSNGQLVKNLIQQRIKKGENILSFDAHLLVNGVYYIIIENNKHRQSLAFSIQ